LALPWAAAYSADLVTVDEAFLMAISEPNAFILDVRTNDEWKWVGRPGPNKLGEGDGLDGKVVNVAYLINKKGELIYNRGFLKDVDALFERDPSVTLLTMCRSGGRAAAAADELIAHGYPQVYNIQYGFEGQTDARGYRTVNGWKVDGLPYTHDMEGVGEQRGGAYANY
jgi:rhodanese-related sulfurtransferase